VVSAHWKLTILLELKVNVGVPLVLGLAGAEAMVVTGATVSNVNAYVAGALVLEPPASVAVTLKA
jgi:hypothetical protein